MRSLLLLIGTCFCIQSAYCQKPCSGAEYRRFDFWLGQWEAYNLKGAKAGDSKISLMNDSCTVLEEWTSATLQKGFRYAGKSFNMYNSAEKQWQEYWVDNTGAVTNYNKGQFADGKMVFLTDNLHVNDSTWLMQRLTFHDLGPDKVRQHGETSNDGGKTWKTSYDLEYRRKK
jgi:hypothetical protein